MAGEDLVGRIEAHVRAVVAERVGATARELSALGRRTTDEMKAAAPWRDDSGNARDSLFAGVTEARADGLVFSLGYGVEPGYSPANAPEPAEDGSRDDPRTYSWHLELGHETRFAVVGPTADRVRDEVLKVRDEIWRGGR